MKDPNPAVRAKAIDDLRMVTDDEAKEVALPLVLAAVRDREAAVRVEAAEALPAFRDNERVLAPLLEALHDPEPRVRSQAANSFVFIGRSEGGFIPNPRVVEPLTTALKDTDASVREGATQTLGQSLGYYSEPGLFDASVTSRAVDALLVCLHDGSPQVRIAAAEALGQDSLARYPGAMTPPPLGAERSGAAGARGGGACGEQALGPAIDPLLEALEDKDPEVRAGRDGVVCLLSLGQSSAAGTNHRRAEGPRTEGPRVGHDAAGRTQG